jgi:hypothetical protein
MHRIGERLSSVREKKKDLFLECRVVNITVLSERSDHRVDDAFNSWHFFSSLVNNLMEMERPEEMPGNRRQTSPSVDW